MLRLGSTDKANTGHAKTVDVERLFGGGNLAPEVFYGPMFDFIREAKKGNESNQLVFTAGRQLVVRNLTAADP